MYREILIAIIPKSTNKNCDWPLVVPFFFSRRVIQQLPYTRVVNGARVQMHVDRV